MAYNNIPQFIDDPVKREERLKNAPRARDRFGNTVIKIGYYWCSDNVERLAQLAEEMKDDEFIICVRVCDGKFFSAKKKSLIRKKSWRMKLETKWYMFIDPEFQEVYC